MIITRSAARLRPTRGKLEHVKTHPGMIVHCTGGSVRPRSTEHALERWRIAQWGHIAPKQWVEVTDENGKVRRVNKGGKGWSEVGYNFAITPQGDVLEGRGWHARGAHAGTGKGHNRWLGVVLFGRGTDITEDEQVAIQSLYAEHLARGGGPLVIPHNAVSRKSCPGPAVTQWLLDRFPQVTDGPG
jgi:hypothetical protein